MFTIKDAVRRQFGASAAESLPEGPGWKRCEPCLYCGRHGTAAVNHDLGCYICHHSSCGRRLSARSVWAATRFEPQVRQAARKCADKFPSARFREALQHAYERVLIYAGSPVPGDADSGMLDDWEAAVDGDQDQLDRFVLQALNCDLLDWAKLRIARARREASYDDLDSDQPPAQAGADWNWNQVRTRGANASRRLAGSDRSKPDYGFSASDYPYLYAREVEGVTVEELAERDGVTVRTVNRKLWTERQHLRSIVGAGTAS